MKERLINSWVSSLIGVGLLLIALGFMRLGDNPTAGILVVLALGFLGYKEKPSAKE